MKTKSIVLIVISLGFGCIAAVGMVQVMARSKTNVPQSNTLPVLVAINDLEINDELNNENVRIEQWPANMIPEGIVAEWEGIEGRRMAGRVIKGYPIQADMLLQPGEFSGLNIRKGYKVYAIKVSETMSFAGLLEPGNRVDLVGIMKRSGTNTQIAKTFLRNVRVFAVNAETNRTPGNDEESSDIRIVQLEVTHAQAEKIALVESLGSLRLVLNGNTEEYASDDEVDESDEPSIEELFGNGGRQSEQVADQSDSDDEGFDAGKLVVGLMDAWTRMNQESAPQYAVNSRRHSMTMISAEGTQVYTWTDRNLPPMVSDLPMGDASGHGGFSGIPAPRFDRPTQSQPMDGASFEGDRMGGDGFEDGDDFDTDFESEGPDDSDVNNFEDHADW